MKHTWTQNDAISALKSGAEINGKVIAVTGLVGLTACSALDYLRNHCGFTVIAKKEDK